MWISTLLPQTPQLFIFRYTGAFPERPYISPSPLSCKRYTAGTVKKRRQKRGTFTRIQIDPFCWRARASLAAPTAPRLPHSPAEKPARTHGATRGFVAFCGNNQQVVAKQGYECISSAVNTVACRVRRLFFCFRTPPSKDAAFVPGVRPGARVYGGGSEGRKDEGRETVGPRDDIYDRCRRMAKSFSLIASRAPCHPTMLYISRSSVRTSSRRKIPDFFLISSLPPSLFFFKCLLSCRS